MPLPSSLPLQQIVAEKKVNLQGEQNQTIFSHLRFQLKPDFVDQKLIYAGELSLHSIS